MMHCAEKKKETYFTLASQQDWSLAITAITHISLENSLLGSFKPPDDPDEQERSACKGNVSFLLVLWLLSIKMPCYPRHLISHAHEWINEIPTVSIYYLAKPQPRRRDWILAYPLEISIWYTSKSCMWAARRVRLWRPLPPTPSSKAWPRGRQITLLTLETCSTASRNITRRMGALLVLL